MQSLAEQTLRPSVVSISFTGFRDCASQLASVPSFDLFGLNVKANCTTRHLACGAARNEGASRCGDAEFVKFFDADDIAMPYQIERMVQLMREHNATVGYHGYFSKKSGPVVRSHEDLRARIRNDKNRWKTFSPFHGGLQTQHGQPMIRRAFLKQFDTASTYQEDIKMAREVWADPRQRIVHTTERLTRYMQRP